MPKNQSFEKESTCRLPRYVHYFLSGGELALGRYISNPIYHSLHQY